MLVCRFLEPSGDQFADDLVIPEGMEVSEPLDKPRNSPGGPADTFQTRLMSVLRDPGSTTSLTKAGLSSLVALQQTAPAVLRRYLATSPCWRVFKERDAVFATRRWMIGPTWRYSLHGYYSQHSVGLFRSAEGVRDFSCRVTLVFRRTSWKRTRMSGSAGPTILRRCSSRTLVSRFSKGIGASLMPHASKYGLFLTQAKLSAN